MATTTYSLIVSGCLVICSFGWPLTSKSQWPIHNLTHEDIIEYYENLISYNVEESENYELPTSNIEFLDGSSDPADIDDVEYDFIIVGAGSAGSALVYGLSEISDWKILLVEAGGDETNFSDIPYFNSNLEDSRMNWGYYSTPQKQACLGTGDPDHRCISPRGKVIGGTGTINGMIYVRGNRHDYDSWAEAGNPGWSYDDVLPYFIKQENSRLDGDPFYHGVGGPITIEYVNAPEPIFPIFIEANLELGREIVDYNGRQQLGVSRVQFFHNHGRRVSGGRAFLDKIKCRRNLDILKNALVTKILISDDKIAQGIELIKHGKKFTVVARKEVIISGGTINSPQLLLLSGIGPKTDLENLGIKVIQNLSVGKNFQDHVLYLGLSFASNITIPSTPNRTVLIEEYLKGSGLYTTSSSAAHAFFRVNDSALPEGVPDSQLIYIISASLNDSAPLFHLYPLLLHEKSRGSVTLSSSDPIDFPAIDLNFYDAEEDLHSMYKVISAIFELIDTEPFRRINGTYQTPGIPECEALGYLTKEYWYCNIRQLTSSGYHLTSTVKMGPTTDKEAVVDSRLKVHGIEGLRVVDNSVIPNVLSGNTNAAAFMIGGKAADIIKEDHGYLGRYK